MPQLIVGAQALLFSALSAGSFLSIAAAANLTSLIIGVGISSLLSAASRALSGGPTKTQDQSLKLAQPNTAPPVRYVYGHCRATGTPAGTSVSGDYIYGCWILNSRWSDLTDFKLYLDKREVTFTGDPYNWTGEGAKASNNPFTDHLEFWISKGDETSPPSRFTSDYPYDATTDPEGWKTTDGWQGITTIWMQIRAGTDRATRWPSAPPFVEIEAPWSRVFDMRDPEQVFNDETTWKYNNNWSLCVLDAFKNNPIKKYQEVNLDLASFETAADVSDISFTLNSGGAEKQFVVAGTHVFTDAELEDQILPMLTSGMGSLIRTGGTLGLLAAGYQTPDMTFTDFLGDNLAAVDLVASSDVINEVRTTYSSPDRGFDTAELKPYAIPGALAEDGGIAAVSNLALSFCPSPTQAMRVRKIYSGLVRRQKSITAMLPPVALDLVPGATINLNLSYPFNVFNGVYEVQSVHPGMELKGSDDSVAMAVPVKLIKHSESIYDWDETVDEEEVYIPPDLDFGNTIRPPSNLTTEVVYENTGLSIEPRINYSFSPSPSTAVINYTVEYSIDGGEFITQSNPDSGIGDGGGIPISISGFIAVSENSSYVIRVKATTNLGASAWVTSLEINIDLTILSIVASGEAGQVRFIGTTPVSPNYSYMKVFVNSTDDFSTSTQAGSNITGIANNTAFDEVIAQSAGTSFYWIAPYTTTNLQGTVSGSYELTVT